jgi:hypothetical protein
LLLILDYKEVIIKIKDELEKENFLTKQKEAKKICFNDKHILFHKKEDDFLDTHLKVNIHNNLE